MYTQGYTECQPIYRHYFRGTLQCADVGDVPLDTQKIKALREKLGLSQEDAARLAGLSSRQRWHHIESGLKANVTVETLESIAKALGVKASDLLK